MDSNYIFLPIASYSSQAVGLAEYVANNHKGGKPRWPCLSIPRPLGAAPYRM
jgi:branched-chain amino acid transport system substrate-binding protein